MSTKWVCRTHDDNEWCTATSHCFDCDELAHQERHPEPVDGCETCRLRSLVVSTVVGLSSRERKFAPIGPKGHNNWEKGTVRDERGMPLLSGDGKQITTKEYAERRHSIKAAQDRLRHDPHVLT